MGSESRIYLKPDHQINFTDSFSIFCIAFSIFCICLQFTFNFVVYLISFCIFVNRIGLKVVTTTSVANRTRKPASIENRKALTVKNQTQQKSLSSSSLSSSSSSLSSSSSCPVIQKGYNGLGGQSRFVKPSATKKLSSRVKVPKSSGLKNSRTIDQSFFVPKKDHPLPDYSISPP